MKKVLSVCLSLPAVGAHRTGSAKRGRGRRGVNPRL